MELFLVAIEGTADLPARLALRADLLDLAEKHRDAITRFTLHNVPEPAIAESIRVPTDDELAEAERLSAEGKDAEFAIGLRNAAPTESAAEQAKRYDHE